MTGEFFKVESKSFPRLLTVCSVMEGMVEIEVKTSLRKLRKDSPTHISTANLLLAVITQSFTVNESDKHGKCTRVTRM